MILPGFPGFCFWQEKEESDITKRRIIICVTE